MKAGNHYNKITSFRNLPGVITACFFLLFTTVSVSQVKLSVFDNFTRYTEEEGLPSSFISGIAEDGEGFLWIATGKGLSRFDGNHFTNYTSFGNDSVITRIGFVESIEFDEAGKNFLIGIEKGIFSTSIDRFEPKSITEEVPGADNFSVVKPELLTDYENILWATNQREGLLKFDLERNSVQQFEFVNDSRTDKFLLNNITCMAHDPADSSVLWLGSIAGLIRFNKITNEYRTFAFANEPELAENKIRRIEVADHEVFLGTWSEGLLIFDKKTEQFRNLPLKDPSRPDKLILDLYKENDSILWITSDDGLFSYNLKKNEVADRIYNEESKGMIRGLSFIDSRGILWFGSGKGLFKYDPQQSQHHFIELEKRSSVEAPLLLRRIIHSGGYFYALGVSGSGIYKINAHDHSFEVIKYPYQSKKGTNNTLRDMVEMEDGKFLVVSEEITIFDPKTQTIELSPLQIDHPFPSVQAVIRDSNDNYWIGTRAAGLYRFNFKNNTIRNFKSEFDIYNEGNYVWINRLYIDKENKLWIAKGSRTVLDLNDTTLHCLDPSITNHTRSYQDVLGFFEDNNGRIWMAGGKNGLGYTRFADFNKGITQQLSGYFSGIYEFNDSLVFTSGKNLGIMNLNTMDYHEMKMKANNKVLRVSGPIVPAENNEYLVGCDNGLLVFDPNEHVLNAEIPAPYISEVVIDGKSFYKGNSLSKKEFEFDSNTKHIFFRISSLGFHFPEEITYQFRFGDEWQHIGTGNEIHLTNLSYGEYTLEIKACNSAGECSTIPLLTSISILTPWWATWWAIILYLAFAIFLADRFYRFQLSRRLAIAERNRLRDVNDLKNNLYANITHEFRTPLTVILGMADSIQTSLTDGKKKAAEHAIEMINRNGRKMLKLVNEMLDLSKLESGKMELQLIQADVVRFVKYLCEGFQSLASENHISFTVYAECRELKMDFDANKLSAVISNILSNAVKFTPEKGNIIVHINREAVSKNEVLVLKFNDSGQGIAKDDLTRIFDRFYQADTSTIQKGQGTGIGLSLTKEFIELMGGSIEVKSLPGEGTEFIVRLPVTNNATQEENVHFQLGQYIPVISGNNSDMSASGPEDEPGLPLALIIEDNSDVTHYLKNCLTGRYQAIEASNGQEGLDLAFEKIPDIVICDVMMPEKDGFTVCAELKADERTDHIPVIMLTAKVTTRDRIIGLSRGADAYLTKPFVKAELLTRLEQLVLLRKKMMKKMGDYSFSSMLQNTTETPETKFLKKIVSIIHEEISNHSFGSSADLSRKMHLSESQIYRKLKAITGKSTAVFIRSVRLQKAKELIQASDKTISEIAYETGFNDPSWFSRAFKEEFGYSPASIAH